MQQTNTVKIITFFLRFQTKELVLRVNKSEITGENTFNADHFETEANHDSINDKETLFLDFRIFVTSALTLRPRNTCIYVFEILFNF